MSRAFRTILGLALVVGGIGAAAFAIYRLVKIGTCASGGPYVSARECPPGTGWFIVSIFGSVLTTLTGFGILATRPSRAPKPALAPSGGGGIDYSTLGTGRGGPAPPTAPLGSPSTLLSTAAEQTRAAVQRQGSPPPPAPPKQPWEDDDGDPLERLERLQKLKEEGALSEVEFEVYKQRILRNT